jgi:hypothetical protein
MPTSSHDRLPLRELQALHAVTMFDQVRRPPAYRGTT